MMTICVGCKKEVKEDEAGWCTGCSAMFCFECEKKGVTCVCLQTLNQIWDAEEAAQAVASQV